jgi:hypothetical protein
VRRSIIHVFEPASERGKKGMDELRQQTVGVLTFQKLKMDVFDAQLGFNLLARYGEEALEPLEGVEERILRHVASLLALYPSIPMPSLRLIQAPVFHGHSFSIWVEFDEIPNLEMLTERLAAAGFESGVRLYRPDGELLRTLSGPCNDLRAVAFSPNCQRVAAAGRNGQLIVWDTESGNVALEITAGTARIRTLAYSPEGDQILSAGDGRFLCAWDAQSGAPLHKIPAKGAKVLALTFCTPQIVATAGSDNLVHVWDWTTQSEKFQLYGHTGTVAALACDPQTATLVSGSYDTTVRVWKLDAPASPRMAQPPRESAPVTHREERALVARGGRLRQDRPLETVGDQRPARGAPGGVHGDRHRFSLQAYEGVQCSSSDGLGCLRSSGGTVCGEDGCPSSHDNCAEHCDV